MRGKIEGGGGQGEDVKEEAEEKKVCIGPLEQKHVGREERERERGT